MDAARHWAAGSRGNGGGKDEAADDLRFYGATDEAIEELLGNDDDSDVFEVWPENQRPLELFLACRTQWRVGPFGGVLGLDYQGVAAVFRMKHVKDQEAMLGDLQVMEAAAIPLLNAKRDD